MYLPRGLISQLYTDLVRNHHPLSPPVLILTSLEADALCACRILTVLLKRDYVSHKIHPIVGYRDLQRAGSELIKPMRLAEGGSGGVVVCLGVGGLVDLADMLEMDVDGENDSGLDGVDIWVFDARRPWNLANVFSEPRSVLAANEDQTKSNTRVKPVHRGQVQRGYKSGSGGIIIYDDGDIEAEMEPEREAWFALEDIPEMDEGDIEVDASQTEDEDGNDPHTKSPSSRKRKSWDAEHDEGSESEKENERPRQRRRSNSSNIVPVSPPRKANQHASFMLHSTPPSNQQSFSMQPVVTEEASARTLRRRLLRLRKKHETTLQNYHGLGTSYSEPISCLMYSLASELGREDNDLLWLATIGVSSAEIYGKTSTGVSVSDRSADYEGQQHFTGWSGTRGSRIRQTLRDEVRRLNPPELNDAGREVVVGSASDSLPTTHAKSPSDNSIRLSPEPRFLLVRHWSLYDSMLHSPYLAAKLHIWSDAGKRRLHKLLAKMGVSLSQCKQSYTHMDVELKKILRERLLHFAPHYGLEGLIPPAMSGNGALGDKDGWGFVRSWGWKACLSAADVATIVGAILELGPISSMFTPSPTNGTNARPSIESSSDPAAAAAAIDEAKSADATARFYAAYDALLSPTLLKEHIPLAQSLHRAILRTGTSLLHKRQVRHLRAFRMAVVKEGPDVQTFINPGALTKLALWVGEAVGEVEREAGFNEGTGRKKGAGWTPLVLGCLDDARDLYVVVGLGGGGGGVKEGTGAAADKAARNSKKEERQRKRDAKEKERQERREKRREDKRKAREADRARRREAREAAGDVDSLASEDEDEAEEEELETETESEGDSSDSDSSDEESEPFGANGNRALRNRFGHAFQQVVDETGARVRLDSFEHCVVEVRKEDLAGFLESLSVKAVVG